MSINGRNLIRSTMPVAGGCLMQSLVCSWFIWQFWGTRIFWPPADFQQTGMIRANVPVAWILCFEWWQKRFGGAVLMSIILNLCGLIFDLLLIVSIGC